MPIENAKKEVVYINYMKALGVLYLLIWHSGCRYIDVFLILFFLQMFFFLSGYFYRDIYTDQPALFLKKRIRSLYLPYVGVCFSFLALNNLFVALNFYKDDQILSAPQMVRGVFDILTLNHGQQMAAAMWFVSVLFFTSILFCALSYVLKNILKLQSEYGRFCLIFLLFTLANYLSVHKLYLPLLIDISFAAIIFYYFGYLYRMNEEKIKINWMMALTAFVVLVFCVEYGTIIMVGRQYVSLPFILVCGILGIYLNLFLSQYLAKRWKSGVLNYIGKHSFVVLAYHFLAFKVVSILFIYINDFPAEWLSQFPTIKSSGQLRSWAYV